MIAAAPFDARTLHLVAHLVRRDFRSRYAGSALGILWSVAVPLSQLLTISFVFGKVVPLGIDKYPLFVFTGLLAWNWFSSALLSAGSIFTDARNLLRSPGVNPAAIVVVRTLVHMLTLVLSLPVLLVMLLGYGLDVPWMFLAVLPLLLLVEGLLITGLSFVVASANVFYRDVAHLVGIVVALLFFVTPVWYAAPHDGPYAFLFDLNPVALVVENYRLLLLEQVAPDWRGLGVAGAIAVVALLLGYRAYRRVEPELIDAI
jgi:ABC-type polysaccharide/polyol phosphate export permease